MAVGLSMLPLVACVGAQAGRIGPAVPLRSAAPRSACEQARWHELVPARVQANGMEAGVGINTTYTQIVDGFGVFEHAESEPTELETLWPALREPELAKKHQAPIEVVDRRSMASLYWALGGLVGMGAGVGVAAGIQEQSGTGAAVAGISGLAIGLVGLVATLVVQPSGYDQLYADARRRLLMPKEDDLDAAARGVDRMNWDQRVRCGGEAPRDEPGIVTPPTPVAPQAPVPDAAPAAEEAPTLAPAADEAPALAPAPMTNEAPVPGGN